jgi:3-polyprenyl-4-hydroxybenzoate decarboxylase
MPYLDIRDYLAALERQDLLKRISQEVDCDRDIGCLVKWMYQALPIEQRGGLFFDNVASLGSA